MLFLVEVTLATIASVRHRLERRERNEMVVEEETSGERAHSRRRTDLFRGLVKSPHDEGYRKEARPTGERKGSPFLRILSSCLLATNKLFVGTRGNRFDMPRFPPVDLRSDNEIRGSRDRANDETRRIR